MPKKSMQDATDKRIFPSPRTQVSTPFHEPVVTHRDLTSMITKSTGSSMGRNNSNDDYTPKTKS